jgi:hypothetical protein
MIEYPAVNAPHGADSQIQLFPLVSEVSTVPKPTATHEEADPQETDAKVVVQLGSGTCRHVDPPSVVTIANPEGENAIFEAGKEPTAKQVVGEEQSICVGPPMPCPYDPGGGVAPGYV